jgi:peptide/nickel transport system substrate-binding protein
LAIAVLPLVLVATACSGGSSAENTAAGEATESQEASAGATTGAEAASCEVGTFRMAVPAVPNNIDLAVYEGTPTSEVGIAYSAPLYEYVDPEGVTPEELGSTGIDSTAPLLVESEVEEEDGSLVLTLKEAVSSYGNTLSAEDVKWSTERALELNPVAQFIASVGQIDPENPVTVIDDRTVRINVTAPNPYTRAALTLMDLSPMDTTEVKKYITEEDPWAQEWLATNTATYGPYVATSFTPGQQLALTANPNWIEGEPAYKDVVIQAVSDSSSRLQLISSGEVDYAMALQPDQFSSLEGTEGVDSTTRRSNTLIMLELNQKFEPFQDERVRQAIAYAIDRQAIVDGAMQGKATVQGNFISKGIGQPTPPEPFTYDPEKARQLLAEAGYADGLEFPLYITVSRPGPYAEQIAVLLEQQLRDVGITADINSVASASEFEERKTAGEYEAWLGANTPILPNPWYQMQLDHHGTQAFQNYKGFSDPTFDAMLDELRLIPSGPERDAKITEAHEYLMTAVPYAPIFDSQNLVAVGSGVDINSVRLYTPYGPLVREIVPVC